MRRATLIPYVLFLAAFTVVLQGLNPTFYVDDSAETVTAAKPLANAIRISFFIGNSVFCFQWAPGALRREVSRKAGVISSRKRRRTQ